MRFGSTVTLNGLLGYLATNSEKILLGRFWGADVVGIYGRAFQLINIPTDNLNATAGEVTFAALSRIQDEPLRVKSYFLKGYSLVLALTVPITIACALFASDIVFVFLGSKWTATVPIFRLLAPTALVFAVVNPLIWLLCSLGLVGRLLKMQLVITPIMIVGYLVGVPYGPKGIALVYSTLMVLWTFPAFAWALRGTAISVWDMVLTMRWPFISSLVAGGVAVAARSLYGGSMQIWLRFVLEGVVLFAVYAGMLLFVTGQKSFYLDLFRGLRGPVSVKENSLASAQ
jgi:PST family polysaccharide transporter